MHVAIPILIIGSTNQNAKHVHATSIVLIKNPKSINQNIFVMESKLNLFFVDKRLICKIIKILQWFIVILCIVAIIFCIIKYKEQQKLLITGINASMALMWIVIWTKNVGFSKAEPLSALGFAWPLFMNFIDVIHSIKSCEYNEFKSGNMQSIATTVVSITLAISSFLSNFEQNARTTNLFIYALVLFIGFVIPSPFIDTEYSVAVGTIQRSCFNYGIGLLLTTLTTNFETI